MGEVVSEDEVEEVTVGAQHQENKDDHNVEEVMVIFLEGFVEARHNKLEEEEGEGESAISFCR